MPSAESRVENTVENVGVVVFPMMTVDKNQKKKNSPHSPTELTTVRRPGTVGIFMGGASNGADIPRGPPKIVISKHLSTLV